MHITKYFFGQHDHTRVYWLNSILCQSNHSIATYDTHSFLLLYISNFIIFLHSLKMIKIETDTKISCRFDDWIILQHDTPLGGHLKLWIFFFLMNPFSFLSPYFFFISKSSSLDTYSWLRKGWWYTSFIIDYNSIIGIWFELAQAIFSDETSPSATVFKYHFHIIYQCLNTFSFIFLGTFLLVNSISLSFDLFRPFLESSA